MEVPVQVGAWLLLALSVAAFGVVAARTFAPGARRPRRVVPKPATMDLGQEPPAVVNLLVNGWTLTPDAAPATLLDLAARGHLELRDPGPDDAGFGARCRAVRTQESTGTRDVWAADNRPLAPYERRVLDHVAAVAGDGEAPTRALTTGAGPDARRWWDAFAAEVLADARRRGLSRPPVALPLERRWLIAAVVAGLGAAGAAAWLGPGEAAFLTFLLLLPAVLVITGVGSRQERDTPRGRAAAAHWLGVRAALGRDRALPDLPAYEVRLRGRHLAYAAAVGLARRAALDLRLGADSLRYAWSRGNGRWRRVAVRRPSAVTWGWHPRGVLALAVGLTAALLPPLAIALMLALGLTEELVPAPVRVVLVLVAAGCGLIIRVGVRLASRAIADLTGPPRDVRGVVVQLRPDGGPDEARATGQVAVDEGVGEVATVFDVPERRYAMLRRGTVVRLKVSRHFGHVRTLVPLTAVPSPPSRRPAPGRPAHRTPGRPAPSRPAPANGQGKRPARVLPSVLTEQIVSEALGWPVQPATHKPDGDLHVYQYHAAAGPTAEVVVTLAEHRHGAKVRALVGGERGWSLEDLGRDAYGRRGAVTFRAGPYTAAIQLRGTFTEERSREILESLARSAAGRPAPPRPAPAPAPKPGSPKPAAGPAPGSGPASGSGPGSGTTPDPEPPSGAGPGSRPGPGSQPGSGSGSETGPGGGPAPGKGSGPGKPGSPGGTGKPAPPGGQGRGRPAPGGAGGPRNGGAGGQGNSGQRNREDRRGDDQRQARR